MTAIRRPGLTMVIQERLEPEQVGRVTVVHNA